MREVLERLKKYARQSDGIEIKKAGSFRGGKSGTGAVVTSGDKNTYLARTDGDIVDMDAAMQRLDLTREFVPKVASLYPD